MKAGIISCPFATKDLTNDGIIAGSLGDAMDIICPITIGLKEDIQGEVISICNSVTAAEAIKLEFSKTKPLDEEGPMIKDSYETEPAGLDRIKLVLTRSEQQPCFVGISKVMAIHKGLKCSIPNDIAISEIVDIQGFKPYHPISVWLAALQYGTKHLGNYSLHAKDTIFAYTNIEKAKLEQEDTALASWFTTIIHFLPYDDPLYQKWWTI